MRCNCLWTISVTGYGSFQLTGTEDAAEEMRAQKADWEGGVGRKERNCGKCTRQRCGRPLERDWIMGGKDE